MTPLLSPTRRADKVLDEAVELFVSEPLAVVRRHHARLVALGNRRIGVGDRLLDVRGVLPLQRLVEVRPDRARGAGVSERMATPATLACEQLCSAAGPAARRSLSLLPDPFVERLGLQYDGPRAHDRVAEPAELGADDG